jgi:hypothetical protein
MYCASFVHARLYAGDHMIFSDELRVGLDDDHTQCDGFLVGFNIFDWVLDLSKTMNVIGMKVEHLKHKYLERGLSTSKDKSVKFKVLDIMSMTTKLGQFGIDYKREQAGKLDIVAFSIVDENNWLPVKRSSSNIYWAFTWNDHDEFNVGPGVNSAIITTLEGDDKMARRHCINSSGVTYMQEDEFLFLSQFLKARVNNNKEI